MNKQLIHNRFAKHLDTYNDNAKVQKRMAEKLISLVNNKTPVSILEIGCGTGLLTEIISSHIDFKQYIAIDIVEDCEKYIHSIDKNIKFLACDIEDFLKENSQKYDLIISNASLQWIDDFKGVISILKNRLNREGELVFSTFGKENFREIYNLMGTSLKYYSESELQSILPNCNILSEIHVMAFKNPKEVLNHLRLTGVNAIENKTWTKKDLIEFENGYKSLCVLRPTLTYNPVYIDYCNLNCEFA